MADLLASGNFTQLDIKNLVEEVRDLSKRERDRPAQSLNGQPRDIYKIIIY